MDIDIDIVIHAVMLLLTVSAIYWRLHFHQKDLRKKINEHDCSIEDNDQKIAAQDRALSELSHEMDRRFNELNLQIEKKFSENNTKTSRRLIRIEKILIKIDERINTHAAGELVEDD